MTKTEKYYVIMHMHTRCMLKVKLAVLNNDMDRYNKYMKIGFRLAEAGLNLI